jgi:hypothetical protein
LTSGHYRHTLAAEIGNLMRAIASVTLPAWQRDEFLQNGRFKPDFWR